MNKKIKRVITKVDRYLYKDEAKGIYNALLLNRDIEEKNLKIHKLTNKAYMIEIKELSTEVKNQIKEDVSSVKCTVYKTTDTLKDLKSRQENREIVQELKEQKEKENLLNEINEILRANKGEATEGEAI